MPDVRDAVQTIESRSNFNRHGITIFLTGLSGAGKTTIAQLLASAFQAHGRPVSLLDGDVLRKCISSELGFSKEHRDVNIRRIGFVASEIAKHGGVSICAAITPYDAIRKEVRAMTQAHGHFLLVYVSTPLSVCERRDVKGLYAKARTGLVECFTGISDPYEMPHDAEIVIDTTTAAPEAAVQRILSHVNHLARMPVPIGGSNIFSETITCKE